MRTVSAISASYFVAETVRKQNTLVVSRFIQAAIVVFALCAVTIPAFGQATFSLTISTPHDVVKAGSEVRVKITLTNTSNHDIGVGVERQVSSYGEKHYEVEVQNEKGVRAPLTRHGHIMRGEVPDPPGDLAEQLELGSDLILDVKPGDVAYDVIIANKMYDLSQPGKYSIQVHRFDPESQTEVLSNTITVTVTPATS